MTFEISKVQEEVLHKIFKGLDPFSILSPGEIDRLILSSRRIHIKKGSSIFEPGDLSSDIFILVDGSVKVSTPNYGNKEVIHELINAPSIFGVSNCCIDDKVKNIATSLSYQSTCYVLPFMAIKQLMENNVQFSMRLLSFLSKQIKDKEMRVEQLMIMDARDRVIGFIKRNAMEKGIRIGYEILLKHNFTQQDIADFAGTSRQTVTNILKELKEKKLIKVQRRRILIRDINEFF